jgi:hypothetical protein
MFYMQDGGLIDIRGEKKTEKLIKLRKPEKK